MKKIRPSYTPFILLLIISTILLILPGSSLPQQDWFGKLQFDKWVHMGMFGMLTILCCWGTLRKPLRKEQRNNLFLIVAAIILGYGIAMEFVQLYFVKNRSFDTGDIIADGIGCIVGFLFSTSRYIKK